LTEVNREGLSRTIPDPVAREIRQRCGFGCVVCGLALYHYHHFDPPFSEARTHDPAGITLLCGSCHDAETRGHLSSETIRRSAANPMTFQRGYARAAFDLGRNRPAVKFGGTLFEGMETLLEVDSEPILAVRPAEEANAPYRLSGLFTSASGVKLFRIEDNEWRGDLTAWDIQVEGGTITVRAGERRIALVLEVRPPHLITVAQIDMLHRGTHITGRGDGPFSVTSPEGSVFTFSQLGEIRTGQEGVGIHSGADGIRVAASHRARK